MPLGFAPCDPAEDTLLIILALRAPFPPEWLMAVKTIVWGAIQPRYVGRVNRKITGYECQNPPR